MSMSQKSERVFNFFPTITTRGSFRRSEKSHVWRMMSGVEGCGQQWCKGNNICLHPQFHHQHQSFTTVTLFPFTFLVQLLLDHICDSMPSSSSSASKLYQVGKCQLLWYHAEISCKVLIMLMKAAKLGCAGPGAGQEQGRSRPGANQEQGRSMSRARAGQEQGRSRAEQS